MDVIERLTLEAASANTMIVCEHRHRYEFARMLCQEIRVLDLCCGSGYGSELLAETAASVVGVDNEAVVIDAARAALGNDRRLSFEAADATEYLESALVGRFDAVVCFEGLEHLPELDRVLGCLRRHAAAGIKLVISVPNSKLFDEDNPFHLTDFSYETARAAFADFPRALMVAQYLAEGSVICPPDARSVDFTFQPQDRLEIEYANHFIFCVGFDDAVVQRSHRGRIQVEAAPVHNRYMRNLEAANSELQSANARLARAHLGVAGSAAATRLFKHDSATSASEETMQAALARADRAEWERDAWMRRCIAAEQREHHLLIGSPQPRAGQPAASESSHHEDWSGASLAEPAPMEGHRASGQPGAGDRPARASRIEAHEVADGLVLYQSDPERVHYLNNTAAIVFELCNGENTIREIGGLLASAFGLAEPPAGLVEACMLELRSKRIVL